MSANSDEWLAGQKLAYAKQKIDDYERLARETGNLVYVWMAIWEAHAANLPMSEWSYGQVTAWAGEIYELAHGVDPDLPFKKEDGQPDEGFASRVHERFEAKREVSPPEAAAKALESLRFSSQGWNAFREVARHERAVAEVENKKAYDLMPAAFRKKKKRDRDQGREERRRRQLGRRLLPK
jgi:hypothetical protein